MESIGSLILYNNNQLIAVNKPSGIASQPDGSGEKSMIDLAEIYCKHKLFLVHRLDRPASGVLLFAKSKKAVAALHKQFKERSVQKIYWAIVAERPIEATNQLVHYLDFNSKKNKAFEADQETGKHCELSYTYLASSNRFHLLQIDLHTGRQHQIRAQLSLAGMPIRGDDKYGFKRGNKDRSIQLHAAMLKFRHPVSGQEECIEASVPDMAVWAAFDTAITQAELCKNAKK